MTNFIQVGVAVEDLVRNEGIQLFGEKLLVVFSQFPSELHRCLIPSSVWSRSGFQPLGQRQDARCDSGLRFLPYLGVQFLHLPSDASGLGSHHD